MQRDQQSVMAALRILSAVNGRRLPDENDIRKVEEKLGPKPENIAIDDWACNVVKKLMGIRDSVRTMSIGGA